MFPWILHQCAEQYGGTVSEISLEDERPLYRWNVSGRNALTALCILEPFLVVKKAQAVLIIQACMIAPGPYRDGLVGQIAALKHYGYRA